MESNVGKPHRVEIHSVTPHPKIFKLHRRNRLFEINSIATINIA